MNGNGHERRERISGYLGCDVDSQLDRNDEEIAKFSLAVHDYDAGTSWYRIVVRGLVARLAKRLLRKGARCTATGMVQESRYVDRQGRSRTELVMRAVYLEADGQSAGDPSDAIPSHKTHDGETDETQALRYFKSQEEYPLRWNTLAWDKTRGGQEILSTNEDIRLAREKWVRGEREVPQDVSTKIPPEEVAAFFKNLAKDMDATRERARIRTPELPGRSTLDITPPPEPQGGLPEIGPLESLSDLPFALHRPGRLPRNPHDPPEGVDLTNEVSST